MPRLFCLTILYFLFISAQGQSSHESAGSFELIKRMVISEQMSSKVIYRLDTLKSKVTDSVRNMMINHFNRDMEFGFKHRRITKYLNTDRYQIDLLSRNDTIYLYAVSSIHYHDLKYDSLNQGVLGEFVQKWNGYHLASKSLDDLLTEITLTQEYALYCGLPLKKTIMGVYIDQLVKHKHADALLEMVKSFHCETQAYGITGLEKLKERGYAVPGDIQSLIDHIKARNAELMVCVGCFSGIVDKIYTHK